MEANGPRYENVASPFMSKEKSKAVMEGWLLLSLDEKISKGQCTKVLRALDDPSFGASFESARVDLEALVGKFKKCGASSQETSLLP